MNIRSPIPNAEALASAITLDRYLPHRVATTSGAVSRLIARAYEDRFGLSIPQWRLMCVLAACGPSVPQAMVTTAGLDRNMVNRAVLGLLRRRLARRLDRRAGERSQPIALTDEGVRLYAEIAPLALAYEAALISGFTPQEVAVIERLLSRLQSAAVSLTGETAAS